MFVIGRDLPPNLCFEKVQMDDRSHLTIRLNSLYSKYSVYPKIVKIAF